MNNSPGVYSLSSFRTSAYVGVVLVFFVGCITITGWIFDIEVLKTILPGAVSMKANTAVAFLLSGISLLIVLENPPNRFARWLGLMAAVCVTLIGLLTFFEYLFGWNLGIDQLVFKETVKAVATSNPGRMAPNTAVNFILIGSGLLLMDWKTQAGRRLGQYFIISANIISALGLLGYIFGVTVLYGIFNYTRMAVNTAVSFNILCISILFSRPGNGLMAIVTSSNIGGLLSRRLLLVAVICPAVVEWIRIQGEKMGIYDNAFGASITIMVNTFIFVSMILFTANSLNHAEEQLTESEARYRMIFTNVGEGIGSVNFQEIFTFANPAAEVIFGVPPGGLVGRNLSEFTTEEQYRVIDEQSSERKKGNKSEYELIINCPNGETRELLITAVAQVGPQGKIEGTFGVFRNITERNQSARSLLETQRLLLAEKELLSTTLMSIADGVIMTDNNGITLLCNRAAESITGYSMSEVVKKPVNHILNVSISPLLDTITDLPTYLKEVEKAQKKFMDYRPPVLTTKNGDKLFLSGSVTSILSADFMEETVGFVIVFQNITERQIADEQKALSQKMEAIGQLAAGIAHEINTPIQYIGDNIKFLDKAYSKYAEILAAYQRVIEEHVEEKITQSEINQLEELVHQKKITYYATEIPKSIQESLDGTERVRKIVLAMREFSHPSIKEKKFFDINHGIQTCIVISNNEWKYFAEMETDLDENLPLVYCQIDEINQVVLNMIVNAAQSIEEKMGSGSEQKGKISIQTRTGKDTVLIIIQDTGNGISEETRKRVFDPFFTTKAIGKGTGQGLFLAHNIIVNNHHGVIHVASVQGQGATFTIELPVNPSIVGAN